MLCLLMPVLLRVASAVAIAGFSLAAWAQSTGLLYDPEPPANSAYVRVALATRDGAVDVSVDGRPRIRKLAAGEASEYMVLAEGKHTIVLHPAGKTATYLTTSLDVVKGRAMTVAFNALRPDASPMIFEDKANANKLKALLAVYHLDSGAGSLDVLTADGSTKVFAGMVPGASAAVPVNPIRVELMSAKAGDTKPQARVALAMAPGGTYSVLLTAGKDGTLRAHAMQNKIERYTGK